MSVLYSSMCVSANESPNEAMHSDAGFIMYNGCSKMSVSQAAHIVGAWLCRGLKGHVQSMQCHQGVCRGVHACVITILVQGRSMPV